MTTEEAQELNVLHEEILWLREEVNRLHFKMNCMIYKIVLRKGVITT